MKYGLFVAAALMLAAPLSAFAESDRMSDGRYLAAAQCVAYAELPQLTADTFNVSALKQAVDSQNVTSSVRDRARATERDAHRLSSRAGEEERAITALRYRRDEACAGFVSTGLVQAAAATPAS